MRDSHGEALLNGEEREPVVEALAPEGPPGGFRSVAVVGLGLMGGSLVQRLHSFSRPPRIIGVDVDSVTGLRVRGDGLVDVFGLPGDGLAGEADLVVLACPVKAALRFLGEEGRTLRPETVVTDVTGLNNPILRKASQVGILDRTVTGHPLCGSESSGFAAARRDLYEGARVWLSADPTVPESIRAAVAAFWTDVGGGVEWIDAAEHDETVAWISHLPQILASALAGALDSAGYRPRDLGPGGRDMTRLAGSSPTMWADLLEYSVPATGLGLTSISRALAMIADLLARREMDHIKEFLELTHAWAHEEDSLAERAEAESRTADTAPEGPVPVGGGDERP
ncbi:MAG: prephenate dehydrogenase [Gemmatimonadales bacterium]|nr:MAG: prephenate dehydrogenase [Gemmatimonadales bacterium]